MLPKFLQKKEADWTKYKDTFGERQKTVLWELHKAPATISELAGRMKWPAGLVASCVKQLMDKGRVRRAVHAVHKGGPGGEVLEAVTAVSDGAVFPGGALPL